MPRSTRTFAPAGIIASVNPYQTSDRLMAEKRLGQMACRRLCLAFYHPNPAPGSISAPITVEVPTLPGLSAAISRQDINGQPPGGWLVERDQLRAGPRRLHPRRSLRELRRRKDRQPRSGKWADFILVDRDVGKVDPQCSAAPRCWKPGLPARRSGSGRLARAPSAVDKHSGRQDLRQFPGSALPARTTGRRHSRPSPTLEEPGDGRIAVSPVANEDDYSASRSALRTSVRLIAAASLTLQVRRSRLW